MSVAKAVVATSPGQTNLSLAAKVARVVELHWIRLRSASLQVDSFDVDQLPPELRFDISHRNSYRLRPDIGALDVVVEYRVDILNDVSGASREALVEAEYQLRYLTPKDFESQAHELKWFAELNGTLNSWPYWREMAQTVLARAGLGSLTLPLWRPTPIRVDETGVPVGDDSPK